MFADIFKKHKNPLFNVGDVVKIQNDSDIPGYEEGETFFFCGKVGRIVSVLRDKKGFSYEIEGDFCYKGYTLARPVIVPEKCLHKVCNMSYIVKNGCTYKKILVESASEED